MSGKQSTSKAKDQSSIPATPSQNVKQSKPPAWPQAHKDILEDLDDKTTGIFEFFKAIPLPEYCLDDWLNEERPPGAKDFHGTVVNLMRQLTDADRLIRTQEEFISWRNGVLEAHVRPISPSVLLDQRLISNLADVLEDPREKPKPPNEQLAFDPCG